MKKRESEKQVTKVGKTRTSALSQLPPLKISKIDRRNSSLKPLSNLNSKDYNFTTQRISMKLDILALESEFNKIMDNKDIEMSVFTFE